MKAIMMMLAAALVLAVAVPAMAAEPAVVAGPIASSFDNLLPDDTILVLSVRNLPELLGKVKETAGYKILEELNLIERLTPPDKYAEMQQFYGTFIEPLGGICSGEAAVVITSLEGFKDRPQIALLIDVSGGETALDEFLNGTVLPLLAEKGIQPETQELAGVKVTKIDPKPTEPDPPIFYAVKDGLLVVTFRDDTMGEILGNMGPGVARAMLPSNTHYASAKKVLGQPDVMFYLNLASILADAMSKQAAGDAAAMAVFGLDTLQNIAFGVAVAPDGGRSTMRITTAGKPGGFLGLFTGGGGAFDSLKYVPAEAGFYYAVNLGDLSDVYTAFVEGLESIQDPAHGGDIGELHTGIAQIEAVLGMKLDEDVLAGFGGEIALMAKVPEAIGVPPAALMIEVKDEAKVEAFIARLIELLGAFGGEQVRTTSAEHEGVQIVRVLLPAPVAPGVAIVGDFLVVGTSAEAVKTVIDAQQGGVGIASRADYKASMAGLPTTGSAMAYIDFKAIYDFVFPLVASKVHGNGEAGELIEALGALGEHLSGIGLVVSSDETGVTYRIHSQSALLEPMIMFGAAAVVPAVFRAREVAQDSVSMANVKQLCVAALVYEQDHGKLPEKMSDLAEYVGAPAIFLHPKNAGNVSLINLEQPETIDQHTDYELVTKGGTLAEIDDPSATVLIQQKELFGGGRRATGYVDGHVTGFPEPSPSRPRMSG